MIALLNQIPSEAKIKKHLKKIIFGKNLFCPHCRSRKVYTSEGRYRCKKCRKPFSLLSGTWLSDMKLSLRTFWVIALQNGENENLNFGRFLYKPDPKDCQKYGLSIFSFYSYVIGYTFAYKIPR